MTAWEWHPVMPRVACQHGVVTMDLPEALRNVEFEIRLLEARLDRAHEHFRSFRTLWAEYLEERPHRIELVDEPDGTVSVRLRRISQVPAGLSVVLGELLYELRAALDNCLYAVAVLVSGQNPPPNAGRLEWPIRADPREWASQSSRYQHLPSEVVEALEAIQPYQAEVPGWNSLAILHDLARMDRHRSPRGLGLYASHLRIKHDPLVITIIEGGAPGIIADGQQVVRLRVAEGNRVSPDNFDLHVEFEVEVTDVSESAGPDGQIGRPWGSLENRVRSLVKAVAEYIDGLLGITVEIVESVEQGSSEGDT